MKHRKDSPNLFETLSRRTCLLTVRMPNPTLRSLAKELGLSRTTVSDALRGSPRVKPDTIKRVLAAAEAALDAAIAADPTDPAARLALL